jgi:hypothetical protein
VSRSRRLRSGVVAGAAQTCPLLLRVFPKVGSLHRVEDFAQRGKEPKEEIQVPPPPSPTHVFRWRPVGQPLS